MSAEEDKSVAEILGELIANSESIKKTQTFKDALAARLAKRAPIQKVAPRKIPRVTIGLHEPLIGKAGETKTASIPAPVAPPGRAYLFRGEKIIAWDTIGKDGEYIDAKTAGGGYGTLLMGMKIGGKEQWPVGEKGTPSHYFMSVMAREMLHDVLHPKLTVDVTVKFLKDCEWSFHFIGRIAEEADTGIYATAPTVPCDREFSSAASGLDEILKEMHGAWRMCIRGGERCERCWFHFSDHARWPWHEHEVDIEDASVLAGKTTDILVPKAGHLLIVDQVRVSSESLRKHFRTDGFNLADFKVRNERDHQFDHYANLMVPESSGELIFRVGNASASARPFAGKVAVKEYVA